MRKIKLVAFDLDGTFLDDNKNIPEINRKALDAAAAQGILLVPATGRLYGGMPEELKQRCRYFILMNGAQVYDSLRDEVLYDAQISEDLALRLYRYADTLDCVYDAYIDGKGVMSADMLEILPDYTIDKNYARTMQSLRTPVPDLKQFINDSHKTVQKAQYHFKTQAEREVQISMLNSMFPGELYVSRSLASNIEINSVLATKGIALQKVCEILGIDVRSSVAFGDGTNDLPMIEAAGIGVCMENGAESCKAAAQEVAPNNNFAGFGLELMKLIGR